MLRPGVRLGDRYRLEGRIGAGGMGEVWRAVDEVLRRTVAVKVMLPSVEDFARRFLAEATAMAQVNHPAVASIHDYGRSGDVTFLVMEFVEGESLAHRLARAGRIPPVDTMRLIAQAADGLQAVHECGIVHRDIKPANLLIRHDGAVLVTDFGISRADDASRLTTSGAILGTPSYLSPEQVLGHPATARSDIYSLGLTAYECLAGRRPFEGDNPYAVALQRLQAAPRTIGVTLPAPILAVVQRALAADPADRWPSAAALAAAARHAATSDQPALADGGRSAAAQPPPPGGPADGAVGRYGSRAATGRPVGPAVPVPAPAAGSGRAPKSRRWWLVALVAVLIGGGVAAWAFTREGIRPAGADGAQPPSVAVSSAAGATAVAGFSRCGAALCPKQPMCWAGLTSVSGQAMPPAQVDCAAPHFWQTFAAVPMPSGAERGRADELMKRSDVSTACSASLLASRSRDPAATRSWRRDAWPINPPTSGATLVHCLVGSPDGETTGSVL